MSDRIGCWLSNASQLKGTPRLGCENEGGKMAEVGEWNPPQPLGVQDKIRGNHMGPAKTRANLSASKK
jgi:hypothetical protein